MLKVITDLIVRCFNDRELRGLINALDVLRCQRTIAIADGLPADHLKELDAEEAAYRARAKQLGAAWA